MIYHIDGIIRSSKATKKEHMEEKLVRWDPIIARFEEDKLRK